MKEQLDKISLAPAKKKEVTESSVALSGSPKAVKIIDSLGRSYGTGRRKNSVARVWIKPGTGKISVNKKEFSEYFARSVLRMITLQPLEITKTLGHFDIVCTVKGGGLSGQAGAMRLGISRALDHFDPDAYHKILRQSGFLTRDQRAVERKKYGQPKARKKFQFSKR